MSCNSGCCGPKSTATTPEVQTQSLVQEQSEYDSCCDADSHGDTSRAVQPSLPAGGLITADENRALHSGGVAEEPLATPTQTPTACKDSCCGQKSEVSNEKDMGAQAKGDCSETSCEPTTINSGCTDNCCSAPGPTQNVHDVSTETECCDGTTLPCCDDSCLDRLALRACEGKKQSSSINIVSKGIHHSPPESEMNNFTLDEQR